MVHGSTTDLRYERSRPLRLQRLLPRPCHGDIASADETSRPQPKRTVWFELESDRSHIFGRGDSVSAALGFQEIDEAVRTMVSREAFTLRARAHDARWIITNTGRPGAIVTVAGRDGRSIALHPGRSKILPADQVLEIALLIGRRKVWAATVQTPSSAEVTPTPLPDEVAEKPLADRRFLFALPPQHAVAVAARFKPYLLDGQRERTGPEAHAIIRRHLKRSDPGYVVSEVALRKRLTEVREITSMKLADQFYDPSTGRWDIPDELEPFVSRDSAKWSLRGLNLAVCLQAAHVVVPNDGRIVVATKDGSEDAAYRVPLPDDVRHG